MKIKNTLLRILSLVLIITMLLPTTINAEENKGNGGGQNSGGSIGSGSDKGDNPFYKRTGWLVYLAKKSPKVEGEKRDNATIESPVMFVQATNNSIPSTYDKGGLKARLDPSRKVYMEKASKIAPWGVPFDDKGNARGEEITNEIAKTTRQYNKKYKSNYAYIVCEYLGEKYWKKVEEDPNNYFLILEACAWYTGRDGKGGYYNIAASTYGWAKAFDKMGKTPVKGDGRDWCALYRLPRSCYLDQNWPSLPKKPTDLGPSHWGGSGDGISYKTILKDYGYGMIAIKTNLQTTCNENVKVPHHPVPEANGDYTIIKNYVIKNGDGTYTHEKCTSKTNSFPVVKVEQEKKITGYKLVAWRVTNKGYPDSEKDHYPQDLFTKAVDSKGKLSWFDKVPGTEKDKGAAKKDSNGKFIEIDAETVNIEELGGKTVFLLLVKEASQSTCDEDKKDHHPAPKESEGDYKIIKNYVTKTGDTYTDDGCHVRKDVTNVIKIEDEAKTTGYKLKAWKTSTSTEGKKITAVSDGGLVWEENVPEKWMKEGKKPATVDLKEKDKKAKTVYLLLIKEKDDIQTTCDEDKPTPHPAPNESKGTYKIVKNYVTKTDDTYTDDGCHSKTNVANKIKIEDEAKTTGYHLEAWKVSTSTKSPVTSVKDKKSVWEENVPATVKKSGTTPKTVDLKEKGHEGNTVYLLLVRDKSKVQTTCDEPIPTPHPAPNESTGTYKIVKNYVTDSNGKYKDDGCFCKTKVTHQIKIEDESTTTGYTLVAWKATDSSTESVTSVASFIFFAFFRCANIM